jgi:hypothetical protein
MARRKHEAIPWETVAKIYRRLLGSHVLDRLALELHGIDVSTGKQVAMTPQSAGTSSAFAWACLEYLRSGYSGDALRANAKALEDAIKVLEADGGEALAIYMTRGPLGEMSGMMKAAQAVEAMRDLAKSLHRQAQRIEAAHAGASFGALLARRLQGQEISAGMARKVYDALIEAAHAEGCTLPPLDDDGALRKALGRGAAKVRK